MQARTDGAPLRESRRVCEPDDIVNVLNALYAERRVRLAGIQVLRDYGFAHKTPDPQVPAQRGDYDTWRVVMAALGAALRAKGIVRANPARDGIRRKGAGGRAA